MSIAELFSKNILQTKGMIDMTLADFSDADMMFRPAKTANHAIWQMGHLANSIRDMVRNAIRALRFHSRGRHAASARAKISFDDAAFFPNKGELLSRFDQAMDIAAAWVAKLSEADFAKPTPEPHVRNSRADSRQHRDPPRGLIHSCISASSRSHAERWASRI